MNTEQIKYRRISADEINKRLQQYIEALRVAHHNPSKDNIDMYKSLFERFTDAVHQEESNND